MAQKDNINAPRFEIMNDEGALTELKFVRMQGEIQGLSEEIDNLKALFLRADKDTGQDIQGRITELATQLDSLKSTFVQAQKSEMNAQEKRLREEIEATEEKLASLKSMLGKESNEEEAPEKSDAMAA